MNFKSKKLLSGIGIFLLLSGSFLLGRASKPDPASTPLVTPLPSAAKASTLSLVSESFKVNRVIDGDTIEIEGGERVRYLGIDTPETADPRKPVQCFGIEASKKNQELVEGKTVRLEKDITDRDKYGRLLRYVWVGDLFVNLELVKQGFATSYSYPPDVKYQDQFLAAEREAREAGLGLWGNCPIPASPPLKTQETPNGECNIKGNISTSGEKIYHLPDCGSYTKTKIDEKRGERWFCSEKEAREAGWRKALNCP